MTDAASDVPVLPVVPADPVRIPAPPSARTLPTVSELTALYVGAYAGRDQSRLQTLRRWSAAIGHLRIDQLDADLVADALQTFAMTPARRFLGRDKATGVARYKDLGQLGPASLNRLRSALSALLRFAKRRRLTPKGWVNPVLEVEALPEDNARIRFLSPDERERLLVACRASSCAKLYLLVLAALTTGARRGELLGLRFGDLDLAAGTAFVKRTKNGQPRVLPLTPAVVLLIRALGAKPAEQLVFSSRYDPNRRLLFETAWRTALRQASIADFRFHDLRHSCASYLAQSGASLLEIADVLGHKSLDVTKRYSHLTVDTKRALVQRVLGEIGAGLKVA